MKLKPTFDKFFISLFCVLGLFMFLLVYLAPAYGWRATNLCEWNKKSVTYYSYKNGIYSKDQLVRDCTSEDERTIWKDIWNNKWNAWESKLVDSKLKYRETELELYY